MDRARLAYHLAVKDEEQLRELVFAAFDVMTADQRHIVFGDDLETQDGPPEPLEGNVLLLEIERFHAASLAGSYYAPFNVNSKNYRDIPPKTAEWLNCMGDLLKSCCQLTAQGNHAHAISCLDLLFELIVSLDRGDEIIYAEERGSWMIGASEQDYLDSYLTSLAATAEPEEFAEVAIDLMQPYTWKAHSAKLYATAVRVANKAQRTQLDAEIQRRQMAIESTQ